MSFPSRPCPKCGRQLEACGVVQVEGGPEMPVYQCDDCIVVGRAAGIEAEMALTFYIDESGRMVNPTAPDEPFSVN